MRLLWRHLRRIDVGVDVTNRLVGQKALLAACFVAHLVALTMESGVWSLTMEPSV